MGGNKWKEGEGAIGCILNKVASRGLTENLISEKRQAVRGQEGWRWVSKVQHNEKRGQRGNRGDRSCKTL